jgi:decaprenylphospho-beta-D-ribofuranose 2-oxidase
VLKRFGPSNPAPLSFPIPGWTLAADVPAAVPGLLEVLDQLDEEVATAGGRLYLAKDSRQLAKIFRQNYSRLAFWNNLRAGPGGIGVYSSCLSKRVMEDRQASF